MHRIEQHSCAHPESQPMPLFEFKDENLSPIRRLVPSADTFEEEIEAMLWADLEAFVGEGLFPIARQARLASGGIPDILALDRDARVVVIEVKRDVDRGQLAQCLEYAGWARTTGLDELAGLYYAGAERFFTEWTDFTDSSTPVVVNPSPLIILVAADFHSRTRSAIEFLQENGLPVTVIPVTMYQDDSGRRFVDVEADHEPATPVAVTGQRRSPSIPTYRGRRVLISDLLEAELLIEGDQLVWERPRKGERFEATVTEDGQIVTHDGVSHASPSPAAYKTAGMVAYDGWHAWVAKRVGLSLDELRQELIAKHG